MNTPHRTDARAPVVSVLLATFNGERYLPEQIDSLLGQRIETDFEIVVRDDGSSDATLEILDRYIARHPDRIRVFQDQRRRLGPKRSFLSMVPEARGAYIAFCDQDDYWHADKLAEQLGALRALEATHGAEVPLMCCSDAAVTDAALQVTNPSYFRKHNILGTPLDQRLARVLFRNYAIGATSMINRALAERCTGAPDEAIMHDWWAVLVASCFGEVTVIRRPLMEYRQHGRNAIGSKARGLPRSLSELREYVVVTRDKSEACLRQARALAETIGPDMPAESRHVLEQYVDFGRQSMPRRVVTMLRTRAFKPGFLLNAIHMYACLSARP